MPSSIGHHVVFVLERAGRRYLGRSSPLFQLFGLQIGGTTMLVEYDASRVYWQRLQLLLDAFFSAQERAAIGSDLLARIDLPALPEAADFLCHLRAEHRLARLLERVEAEAVGKPAPPRER